jgi:hypothetical protein
MSLKKVPVVDEANELNSLRCEAPMTKRLARDQNQKLSAAQRMRCPLLQRLEAHNDD